MGASLLALAKSIYYTECILPVHLWLSTMKYIPTPSLAKFQSRASAVGGEENLSGVFYFASLI